VIDDAAVAALDDRVLGRQREALAPAGVLLAPHEKTTMADGPAAEAPVGSVVRLGLSAISSTHSSR
jgi:hypothetical protein